MANKRRLSPVRVILAVLILAGIFYFGSKNIRRWEEERIIMSTRDPWFASYVDVTAKPQYPFEQNANLENQGNVVLAFIVSSSEDACTPSWGNYYSLDEANDELDLDRRIARLRQLGGSVAVSFGGQLNDELAINCKDFNKLKEAYKSIIDRYDIDTIDFDIEGEGLSNPDAIKRRAKVIADLQKEFRSNDKNLAVWLTLPVTPQGLTESGTNAVASMLSNGIDLSGVNIMTMDYGESRQADQTMQYASERALIETHRQLGILYDQAHISLSDTALWAKLGATPMIGQNDILGEIFTLDDAKGFNEFTLAKGLTRMSMWSANRDIKCGDNYVNITVVSDSCSGIKQEQFDFANTLGQGFSGDISSNSSTITIESPKTKTVTDDPAKSPYQIWTENGTYLEGTKVVWHQNVYQAKWWTKGDIPDNPVLQAYQTPWQLVGPVLPGEKPIPQPTLPLGTYPVWDGTVIYDAGERVLFNNVPYEAEWWTQGDSPAAATSNPDSSPWITLTKEQIERIIEKK